MFKSARFPARILAREGRLYRYYVSSAVQLGRQAEAGSLARIPAPAIEALVGDRMQRLGATLEALRRVEVGRRRSVITLGDDAGLVGEPDLPATETLGRQSGEIVLTVSASMKWRGGAKVAIGAAGAPAVDAVRIDLPLLRALIRAETWKRRLEAGGVSMDALADQEGVHRAYAQRIVRLAWLSPSLKRSIVDGHTPGGLTLSRLLQEDIPLAWAEQQGWAERARGGD